MNFFKYNFPKTQYEVKSQLDNYVRFSQIVEIPNFYRHVSILNNLTNDDHYFYEPYQVLDGERPDTVSHRIWGSVNYYWVLFLINDQLRLGSEVQWPMSQKKLREKLDYEFNGKALIVPRDPPTANSQLPGKFQIGETVQGSISLATGVIQKVRADFGQLIVSDVSGTFSTTGESIVGQSTGDSVNTGIVNPYSAAAVDYADAVYYYENSSGRYENNEAFIEPADPIIGVLTPMTFREHFENINDDMSRIRVFRQDSLQRFVQAYRDLMRRR